MKKEELIALGVSEEQAEKSPIEAQGYASYFIVFFR